MNTEYTDILPKDHSKIFMLRNPEVWYGEADGGGGSGWGTHVHPWQIHVDIWQNQYNIVK